jgi:twitching motility protein PilT
MDSIDELIRISIERDASDLHITVGMPPVLRIDGALVPLDDYPKMTPDDIRPLVLPIVPDHRVEQLDKAGDVDFAYVSNNSRLRVNVFKQRGSLAAALRVLATKTPTLEELGHPEVISRLAMLPRGLVLVTGPTGSGKSTTLAAMIDFINRQRSCHIITIEDPIEYLHKHKKCIVNQRELNEDTVGFASALRAALREDPDIVLVGEMRDLDTIQAAVTAAETGHLVLSTLHTSGAASTIDRIIDVFPPSQHQQIRIQLSDILQGVVTQQLLPRMGEHGRIAALEIMVKTDAISNLIREGKTHQINNFIQTGKQHGMQSMDACLAELAKSRKISMEEAKSRCVDIKEFNRYL